MLLFSSISMSWTVVKFIKDDTVEAVPTNWVVGSQCFWPQEKVLKAIQTCQSPTDNWKKYNIARFKGITSYGKSKYYFANMCI